ELQAQVCRPGGWFVRRSGVLWRLFDAPLEWLSRPGLTLPDNLALFDHVELGADLTEHLRIEQLRMPGPLLRRAACDRCIGNSARRDSYSVRSFVRTGLGCWRCRRQSALGL